MAGSGPVGSGSRDPIARLGDCTRAVGGAAASIVREAMISIGLRPGSVVGSSVNMILSYNHTLRFANALVGG